MKTSEINSILTPLSEAIQNLSESEHKLIMLQLLNLIESLASENQALSEAVQKLRDENNRLKGEQGKPTIRPQTKKPGDISSEQERKSSSNKKKKKRRQSKKPKLRVTHTATCQFDKSKLPEDAIFKGHERLLVQDIKVVVETIEFKKEIYYSPSLNKSFMASLPVGYEGEFGPHLKSLVLGLKHICQMSEPKILEFLENHKVLISGSTISRILLNQDWVHEEKQAIFQAGLSSSVHQHIDDTKARVHGKNHHTHILCNDFYTAYFTTAHKDRLSVLDILRGFKPRCFLLNDEFVELLEILGLAQKWVILMKLHLNALPLDEFQMQSLLDALSEKAQMGETIQKRIREAAAIAAYHQEEGCIALLICDDAPQFKLLALSLALCWIHEGRHYKKLSPVVPFHQDVLKSFLDDFWNYYHQLLAFKKSPTELLAKQLREQFDELFSIQTGYDDLDQRISKTHSKAEALLQVLQHPQIPVHNNSAELGARSAVRRRDVSLHTMTSEGTQAIDSFMTLIETAKKHGISTFHHIHDRIRGKREMPSLAQVIEEKTRTQTSEKLNQNNPLIQSQDSPIIIKAITVKTQTKASFFVGIKKIPSQALIAIKQKVEGGPSAILSYNTS